MKTTLKTSADENYTRNECIGLTSLFLNDNKLTHCSTLSHLPKSQLKSIYLSQNTLGTSEVSETDFEIFKNVEKLSLNNNGIKNWKVITFTRLECSFHIHSTRVQFSSSLVSSVVFIFTRRECSFHLHSLRVQFSSSHVSVQFSSSLVPSLVFSLSV